MVRMIYCLMMANESKSRCKTNRSLNKIEKDEEKRRNEGNRHEMMPEMMK